MTKFSKNLYTWEWLTLRRWRWINLCCGLKQMKKHSIAETFLVLYPHTQCKGDQTVLECSYILWNKICLSFTGLLKCMRLKKICVYILGILICLKCNMSSFSWVWPTEHCHCSGNHLSSKVFCFSSFPFCYGKAGYTLLRAFLSNVTLCYSVTWDNFQTDKIFNK